MLQRNPLESCFGWGMEESDGGEGDLSCWGGAAVFGGDRKLFLRIWEVNRIFAVKLGVVYLLL